MKRTLRTFLGMTLLLALAWTPAYAGEEERLHDAWSVMTMAGDEVGWIHSTMTKVTEKSGESSTERKRKRA